MFKFITGKPLWANILFAIGLVFLILFLILQSLNLITKHGDTLIIPSVTGKPYDQAKKILEEAGFDVQIQDSIYSDTAKALSVMRQFPEGEAVVKVNRTVYLTINRAVAPEIEMPNLEGMSFRSAELALKQYNLHLEDTSYQENFARNAVLEQLYKGQRIKAGTKLAMGSGISLVLGSGAGQDQFPVPELVGMTFAEAKVLLESNNFLIGSIALDAGVSDTAAAFIYSQQPEANLSDGRMNMIRKGQFINVRLQVEKPVRAAVPDSTGN